MVKDIHPTGSGSLRLLTVFNNKLFFSADDGTNGNQLWESDGTLNGTKMLVDINSLSHS